MYNFMNRLTGSLLTILPSRTRMRHPCCRRAAGSHAICRGPASGRRTTTVRAHVLVADPPVPPIILLPLGPRPRPRPRPAPYVSSFWRYPFPCSIVTSCRAADPAFSGACACRAAVPPAPACRSGPSHGCGMQCAAWYGPAPGPRLPDLRPSRSRTLPSGVGWSPSPPTIPFAIPYSSSPTLSGSPRLACLPGPLLPSTRPLSRDGEACAPACGILYILEKGYLGEWVNNYFTYKILTQTLGICLYILMHR